MPSTLTAGFVREGYASADGERQFAFESSAFDVGEEYGAQVGTRRKALEIHDKIIHLFPIERHRDVIQVFRILVVKDSHSELASFQLALPKCSQRKFPLKVQYLAAC